MSSNKIKNPSTVNEGVNQGVNQNPDSGKRQDVLQDKLYDSDSDKSQLDANRDALFTISATLDKLANDQKKMIDKDKKELAKQKMRMEAFSQKIRGKQSSNKFSNIGSLGSASLMGLHMVSGPIAGGAIGYLVDRIFHTDPVGIIIGIIIGIAGGFYTVWLDAKVMLKKQGGKGESSRKDI